MSANLKCRFHCGIDPASQTNFSGQSHGIDRIKNCNIQPSNVLILRADAFLIVRRSKEYSIKNATWLQSFDQVYSYAGKLCVTGNKVRMLDKIRRTYRRISKTKMRDKLRPPDFFES